MSRGKRARKARSIRRQIRKAVKFKRYAQEASAALENQIEASKLRAEINASDAPAAAKTVLGFLVDPHGTAFDLVRLRAHAARITKGEL